MGITELFVDVVGHVVLHGVRACACCREVVTLADLELEDIVALRRTLLNLFFLDLFNVAVAEPVAGMRMMYESGY